MQCAGEKNSRIDDNGRKYVEPDSISSHRCPHSRQRKSALPGPLDRRATGWLEHFGHTGFLPERSMRSFVPSIIVSDVTATLDCAALVWLFLFAIDPQ